MDKSRNQGINHMVMFFMQRFLILLCFFMVIRLGVCDAQDSSSSIPIPPPFIQGMNVITEQADESISKSIHYEKYQEGWNSCVQESLFLSKDDFRIGRIKTIYLELPACSP